MSRDVVSERRLEYYVKKRRLRSGKRLSRIALNDRLKSNPKKTLNMHGSKRESRRSFPKADVERKAL